MAYKNKEIREQEFVEQLLSSSGIKRHGKTYEKGHWYWFFNLSDGSTRYWTDLSDKNGTKLGIKLDE